MELITFYKANEKPYGCFSNLYRRPVVFEGEEFPTAEHAYQAGKARQPKVRAWLLSAPSPSLLAGAAHAMHYYDIVPGWSKNRIARMRGVVDAKFRQHPDLAEILLSTGDAHLIERGIADNEVNRRWGEVKVKGEWVGLNWLGRILMETRTNLRFETSGMAGHLMRAD